MQHIDEGGLHAYLDGALDEYRAGEAARIRDHLETCSECRGRLGIERAIRERATEILGAATPRVETPTLEELRSYVRSAAGNGRRVSRRTYWVGWAASVVLALGLGWSLRGVPAGPGADEPAPEAGERVASASNGDGPVRSRAAGDTDESARTPEYAAALEVQPTGQVEVASVPEALPDDPLLPSRTVLEPVTLDGVVLDARASAESQARVLPDLDERVPPLPTPTLDTSGVPSTDLFVDLDDADRLAVGNASGGNTTEEVERPNSAAPVITSASQAADAPGVVIFGRQGDDLTSRSDEPVDDDSYSLVVPNLEVLEVRFRGSVRPEGQVVLQRLASGDTLEVIHLPLGIEPSSLEAADPSDRQLVLQIKSGWIVMRAPVGEDELMELMTRLLSAD
jgi:hypothetical protein